jgi:hypothetical protein
LAVTSTAVAIITNIVVGFRTAGRISPVELVLAQLRTRCRGRGLGPPHAADDRETETTRIDALKMSWPNAVLNLIPDHRGDE